MKELTLKRAEDVKTKINERLKGLNIEIEVQSSFVIMVGLLIEEMMKETQDE